MRSDDLDDYRYWMAYYYVLKAEARRIVAEALNRKNEEAGTSDAWSKVSLASIDQEALDQARLEWPKHYSDQTHNGFQHSWETLYRKSCVRPAHFDLAIWQIVDGKRVLQGLALGKPSNAKTRLALNWVERSFAPTYLKSGILLPVLACLEEYGKLLGARHVVIREPIDPEKYGRYGYARQRLKAVGKVMMKELSYGDA